MTTEITASTTTNFARDTLTLKHSEYAQPVTTIYTIDTAIITQAYILSRFLNNVYLSPLYPLKLRCFDFLHFEYNCTCILITFMRYRKTARIDFRYITQDLLTVSMRSRIKFQRRMFL